MTGLTFLSLPLELRQAIYHYIFSVPRLSDFTFASYVAGYKREPCKPLPNLLLVVNKQISAEATDYLWSKNTHQICTGIFHAPPDDITGGLGCASVRQLQKKVLHLSDPRIRRWHIRLLFPFMRRESQILLMDAIIWMLSRNAATIRAVEFTLPCLCAGVSTDSEGLSDYEPRGESPANTPEKWTAMFQPLLDRLAELKFRQGTVSFSFARREYLPLCPLRKCNALASGLENLKIAMQGGNDTLLSAQPITTYGLGRYRCKYWHRLYYSSDGDVVDCGCGENDRRVASRIQKRNALLLHTYKRSRNGFRSEMY